MINAFRNYMVWQCRNYLHGHFVMSYKEKIPKQVLDILIIVLGIAMVVVSCILIAFAIKNGVKKR